MTIFYLVIEYLNQLIQSRLSTKQVKVDNTIDIFVEFLKKEHEKECTVVECFCRNSEIYRNKQRMSLFDPRLKGTGVLEMMILLENLLLRTYISNKEYSDCAYHCYSYFLIHYMGKNFTAYKLLQERLEGRAGKDKTKKVYSIEELAILDDITSLNYHNLKSGNLALSYFP